MKETRFTVKGRGGFPIDMLRYDSAYPARASDAADIQGSLGDDPGNPVSLANREVWEIDLISALRNAPTVERWSSFGVKVTIATIYGRPIKGL